HLCGLDNLMTYIDGVGLEPLEICESFFSKSNAPASTTHFHPQEAITTYLKHTDTFETYQGLTLMLCNKYRHALEIKKTYAALWASMWELGVELWEEFHMCLGKEKAHLRTLSKEPAEVTLEMEYYQELVNLCEAEYAPIILLHLPSILTCAQRERDKVLVAVHDLEERLEIMTPWVPGDEKWVAVATMVWRHRYQRVLDHLQGLIIARMFELANCDMSGTAEPALNKLVPALNKFNPTLYKLDPAPKKEEVVEYAFLVDFDLLCEGREDICGEPWAQLAG
ncbi:hypothetical protein C8R44DRAFT_647404, partial [Mycena epipterygia]